MEYDAQVGYGHLRRFAVPITSTLDTYRDPTELDLRVLGFREDGMWCAIALELDLYGTGRNFDEAVADLKNAVDAQVSFAIQHDNLDGILFPADERYFDLYKNAGEGVMTMQMRHAVPASSERNWEVDEEDDHETRQLLEATQVAPEA